MKHSGPLLPGAERLDHDIALQLAQEMLAEAGEALKGDARVGHANRVRPEADVGPILLWPVVNPDAERIYPEYFLILGLVLASFVGGVFALLH